MEPILAPALAFGGGLVVGAGAHPWPLAAILLSTALAMLWKIELRRFCVVFALMFSVVLLGYTHGRMRVTMVSGPDDVPEWASAGVWVRGEVDGFPTSAGDEMSFSLEKVFLSSAGDKWERLPGNIRVTLRGGSFPLAPQTEIVFRAPVRPYPIHRNFDLPSPEPYRALRGEIAKASLEGPTFLRVLRPAPAPIRFLTRFRESVGRVLEETLGSREGGVLKAVLLGMSTSVPPPVRYAFCHLGVAHLLAISGLHLGFLYGLVYFFVKKGLLALWPRLALRFRMEVVAGLAALGPAFLFLILSGARVPTLRAFLFLALFLLGVILWIRVDPFSLLILVAVILAAAEPILIFTPSYLLTFAGAGGLILFFRGRGKRLGTALLLTPLAAFLAVEPIAAGFFHSFPVLFYPANLVLVPLFGLLILPLGLVSVVLLPIFPGAGIFLLAVIKVFLTPVLKGMETLSAVPALNFPFPAPPPSAIGIVVLVMIWVWSRSGLRDVIRLTAAGGGLAALIIVGYVPLLSSAIELTFYDLPIGEAALIRRGLKAALVDTGGSYRDVYDPALSVLIPSLHGRGIKSIRPLVLSHSHADHVGGSVTLVKSGLVEEVIIPEALSEEKPFLRLRKEPVEFRAVHRGQEIPLAGEEAWIIWPPEGEFPPPKADPNRFSLALQVSFEGIPVLLAGDLIGSDLLQALAAVPLGIGGVYKATHHGGSGSRPDGLLEKVAPEWVILTGRRFARPLDQWRELSRRYRFQLADTASEGAVRVTIDPDRQIAVRRPARLLRARKLGGG